MTIMLPTLYPPLVSTYMPAFIKDEPCRIYFSKTIFNASDLTGHVQLTLSYLNNNMNALKSDSGEWPNQIKLCKIYTDSDTSLPADYRNYVIIDPTADVKGETFQAGQYYKVQLRLSSVDPTGMPDVSGLYTDPGAAWFHNNLQYFSEWSTVCLLKGIPEPVIALQGLTAADQRISTAIYDRLRIDPSGSPLDPVGDVSGILLDASSYDSSGWYILPSIDATGLTAAAFDTGLYVPFPPNIYTGNSGNMLFVGQYYNEDSSEPLLNYYVNLYDATGGVVTTTETFCPTSSYQNGNLFDYADEFLSAYYNYGIFNGFSFSFDVILTDATDYTIEIVFTSKNGYVFAKTYSFLTQYGESPPDIYTISSTIDNDNGRIILDISGLIDATGSALLIKRTDNHGNFTKYETVFSKYYDATGLFNEIFYDYTVESGTLYQYYIGYKYTDIFLPVFSDIFIVGEDRQLMVKFNPKISSFKYTVLDSKTETLGGTYPFVRRNANVKYREFPLGGLISFQMDENNLFTSGKTELYGTETAYTEYVKYETDNNINDYVNQILEKKFRDAVLDFLYDGNMKLFKSTTEGNMIVKITNVSLSPIESLGRMIYEFSADVTEIAEFTLDNCILYNIHMGELNE